MTIAEHIASLPADRQALMNKLHQTILGNDPSVVAAIKPMMRQEMILYEQSGTMKYGLASAKAHLSFHCLPMYMDPALHTKYQELLPAAKFQKGCINFTDINELPPETLSELVTECAVINIAQVLADRKKKK
jgi:hypothetical protein